MILLIDNYDSFVFNLARYVNELGHKYLVKRNDAISIEEIINQIKPSHIILSPGPCTPLEAGICMELVSKLAGKIPILGVCLGHQAIAAAYGGEIVKAMRPTHGQSCLIHHDGIGLFQGLPNPILVGRYHSLAVCPETLPKGIHINARSEEGDIMAMQQPELSLFSVQFHPESILTEHGHDLLRNFLCM